MNVKMKGFAAAEVIIGLVIAVILFVAVAIPVTINVVNNTASSFTPTTATVAAQLQLLLAVSALVAIAGSMTYFIGRRE